jgi:poly-D-alanine transfer protein DltD
MFLPSKKFFAGCALIGAGAQTELMSRNKVQTLVVAFRRAKILFIVSPQEVTQAILATFIPCGQNFSHLGYNFRPPMPS